MVLLSLPLVLELCLAFGMAGLFWPEKFMPVFDLLLFPWAASHRVVRAHSIAAIAAALFLLVMLLIVRS